jgi:hypothetical protein
MPQRPGWPRFLALNLLVWLAMVVILVLVPDLLARQIRLEIARVIGWAVACGVWVVAVEREWQARFGPLARFALQLVLWVAAAIVAIWISESSALTAGLPRRVGLDAVDARVEPLPIDALDRGAGQAAIGPFFLGLARLLHFGRVRRVRLAEARLEVFFHRPAGVGGRLRLLRLLFLPAGGRRDEHVLSDQQHADDGGRDRTDGLPVLLEPVGGARVQVGGRLGGGFRPCLTPFLQHLDRTRIHVGLLQTVKNVSARVRSVRQPPWLTGRTL